MSTADLDAEILRHAIAVAAEEASIVVVRGAYSVFILEGADAAAAILDIDGRLVGHSASTSLAHGASLRCSLPAVLAAFPPASMRPGDVFVMNDVYRGGIHANDLIVFRPVFVDAAPAYVTGTLIHVADLGGLSAGGMASSATDVFLEGLQLPPMRLADADGLVPSVVELLRLNSRQPDRLLGDVRALVAGTAVAARRMEELVARHGVDALRAGVDGAIAHARSRLQHELRALPEGTYRSEYPIDDDGIALGVPRTVRVAVTVRDGRATIDFSGTDAQVRASINAGFSQVISGAMYALRCFVDATIPMNEGCFDAVDMVLPEGTLVNPTPPHPAGGRYVTVSAAIEAIYRALSQARPERAVAASGLIHPFSIAGRTDAGTWLHMAFDFGGSGARRGKDGLDATGGLFGGGRNLVPQVEAIEARLPVRVECVELIDGSGGAGRWRGGRGTRTVIRLLADASVDTRSDRCVIAPQGFEGGEPGRPGAFLRVRPDGTATDIGAKAANVAFAAGDALVVETSGGGGLGEEPADDQPSG